MSRMNVHQEPIFIVGFPRSGTTFLQALLATQDKLMSFPETHFFNKAVGHYNDSHQLTDIELSEALEILKEKTGVDLKAVQSGNGQLKNQKYLFEVLINELAKEQDADMDEGHRWIEKTPAHAMFMSKIFNYYPEAKFIAIKRNPLNAIDSYYRKLIGHRKPHHDLAEEYRSTYVAIDNFAKIHPDKVMFVSYEDLTRNRNSSMERILHFIGGELDVLLLDNHTHEAKKLIKDDETWKNSNVKADKEFEILHHKLSLKHILQIQHILKPFMIENNYPLQKVLIMTFYEKYRAWLRK